jgi:hypothetical protein
MAYAVMPVIGPNRKESCSNYDEESHQTLPGSTVRIIREIAAANVPRCAGFLLQSHAEEHNVECPLVETWDFWWSCFPDLRMTHKLDTTKRRSGLLTCASVRALLSLLATDDVVRLSREIGREAGMEPTAIGC